MATKPASPPEAVQQQTLTVQGLQKPARIVIDHWGIAHIFAANVHDAFFLQGFNAARDRLWQIDLWRKRGLGLLAKNFGASYVDQDRAARLFLYRGDMTREWAAYAPETHDATEAFVQGINAYAREVRAGTKPLPPEFKLTATLPDDWQTDDLVRIRSHALVSNVTSEVARAYVACAAGISADRLRRKLDPPHTTVVPQGLDPCDVGDDVLKDYVLATEQVSFAPPPKVKGADNAQPLRFGAATTGEMEEGSNNWVIAPSHSATGRAILANDPHRQLGVPALRYIVHLSAPGFSIIGAGEPALPGVSFGHNDSIAWGLTIFNTDQEDLYVYTLKPGDPNFYRYGNGYEAMRIVHETIEVKGEAPRDVELRFTRHGPVLALDAAKGRAFAMRTVWNEPGVSGYLGSSRMWRAQVVGRFQVRARRLGRAAAQSRLRGHQGKYRLGTGRHHADPSQLGRVDAGAGRRPLRMAGISQWRSVAVRVQSEAGLVRDGERNEFANRLSGETSARFPSNGPTPRASSASRRCWEAIAKVQSRRFDGSADGQSQRSIGTLDGAARTSDVQ